MTSASHAPRTKVLFLSGLQIHPPRSGGQLRSLALASALEQHGLEVFVYSLVGRKADYLSRRASSVQKWPAGIEEYVDRGLLGFVAQYGSYALALPPLWMSAYLRASVSSPGELLLPAALRSKLAWSDVVVADYPFVHPVFASRSARGRLRVLSTHNVEHHLWGGKSGWLGHWLRDRVRHLELSAAETSDILVTCCSADRQFFETHARVHRSVLVPNGIDVRRFRGIQEHRGSTRQALGIADDVKLFLFTASKWGPNREAFDYLVAFANSQRELLVRQGIHILVVGSVVPKPVSLPGFTATGMVDVVEPYFAAADAALNPLAIGAGTNVKMCEFIAARLPILTTLVGARGFRIEDGRSGFLFERDELARRLSLVRRLFDADPARLRQIASDAFAQNEGVIDMNSCAAVLVEALSGARPQSLAVNAL